MPELSSSVVFGFSIVIVTFAFAVTGVPSSLFWPTIEYESYWLALASVIVAVEVVVPVLTLNVHFKVYVEQNSKISLTVNAPNVKSGYFNVIFGIDNVIESPLDT